MHKEYTLANFNTDVIDIVTSTLRVSRNEICNITTLKKGMTNRSFLFEAKNEKYIIRIPGEGTDKLINRYNETKAYEKIVGLGFCENPLYINPDNGIKITKYIKNVRSCNPEDTNDLKYCMYTLRKFHKKKLKVSHTFDLFERIDFYESLWEGKESMYKDYMVTKSNVFSLKPFIDANKKEYCLTHIDAVPDNFLFYRLDNGKETLQLIDWEYASMQDPHVDIAMFCIYSLYNKNQIDALIDIYFEENCDDIVRRKIYCYIAVCGLLWSNWCEFKKHRGVEFGEYSIKQYEFAKDYYRIVKDIL